MSRLSVFALTTARRAADRWSMESVARSRRNALMANTALAARRAERDDAAAYVAARASRDAAVRVPGQRRELV